MSGTLQGGHSGIAQRRDVAFPDRVAMDEQDVHETPAQFSVPR